MTVNEFLAVSNLIIAWIMAIIAVDEWWRGRKKEQRELEKEKDEKKDP